MFCISHVSLYPTVIDFGVWYELRFYFIFPMGKTLSYYGLYFHHRSVAPPLSSITFPYVCGLLFGFLSSFISQIGVSYVSTSLLNYYSYIGLDIWNIKPSQLCSSSRLSWLYLSSFSFLYILESSFWVPWRALVDGFVLSL